MTETRGRNDIGDILTIGFGTTVAMWTIGYLCRMPGSSVPNFMLFGLLIAFGVLGGAAAGRFSRRSWTVGLWTGLVTGFLNLLLVGSLISREDAPGLIEGAAIWAPMSIVLMMVLTGVGALIGRATRGTPHTGAPQCGACGASLFQLANNCPSCNKPLDAAGIRRDGAGIEWPVWFAFVAVAATVLLIAAGGVVTGAQAGLDVPDWPNTFGRNMFLYPLARMTGGIYFEHTHRLLGSLVGLTTIALAVYTWSRPRRPAVREIAILAVLLVVAQGLLGALRVTGKFTLSEDAAQMAPQLSLAVVHGILAQLFLGVLVVLAILMTRAWREAPATAEATRDVATNVPLSVIALALLICQLAIGAVYRHYQVTWALHLHLTIAVLLIAALIFNGIRAAAARQPLPITRAFRLSGRWLNGLAGFQLLLGLGALVAVMLEKPGDPHAWHVAVTTAHQTTGALLMAFTVAVLAWETRLTALRSRPAPDFAPA
ncbi:MAG: COX15/CtaA family protein [Phycisphaerales bacterium]|nr:COX15/CtaA family protein [Phycisphaerales bacterium]